MARAAAPTPEAWFCATASAQVTIHPMRTRNGTPKAGEMRRFFIAYEERILYSCASRRNRRRKLCAVCRQTVQARRQPLRDGNLSTGRSCARRRPAGEETPFALDRREGKAARPP